MDKRDQITQSSIDALKSLNIPVLKAQIDHKIISTQDWHNINEIETLKIDDSYAINFAFNEEYIYITKNEKQYVLMCINFNIKNINTKLNDLLDELFQFDNGYENSLSGSSKHLFCLIEEKNISHFFYLNKYNKNQKFEYAGHSDINWQVCLGNKYIRVYGNIPWNQLSILSKEIWTEILSLIDIDFNSISNQLDHNKQVEQDIRYENFNILLEKWSPLKDFHEYGIWDAFKSSFDEQQNWDTLKIHICPMYFYFNRYDDFIKLFDTHKDENWSQYKEAWLKAFPRYMIEEFACLTPKTKQIIDKIINRNDKQNKFEKFRKAVEFWIQDHHLKLINGASKLESALFVCKYQKGLIKCDSQFIKSRIWSEMLDITFEKETDKHYFRPKIEQLLIDLALSKNTDPWHKLQSDYISQIGFKNGGFAIKERKFTKFINNENAYTNSILYYNFDYDENWTPDKGCNESKMFYKAFCDFFSKELTDGMFAQFFDVSNNNRAAIFLVGASKLGKSTFFTFLAYLFGIDRVAIVNLQDLKEKFLLLDIPFSLIMIGDETKNKTSLENTKIKSVISNEMMSIEQKFKDPIKCKPFTTCIFASNKKPTFDNTHINDGIITRLFVHDFEKKLFGNTFDEKEILWFTHPFEESNDNIKKHIIHSFLHALKKFPKYYDYRGKLFTDHPKNMIGDILKLSNSVFSFFDELIYNPVVFDREVCVSKFKNDTKIMPIYDFENNINIFCDKKTQIKWFRIKKKGLYQVYKDWMADEGRYQFISSYSEFNENMNELETKYGEKNIYCRKFQNNYEKRVMYIFFNIDSLKSTIKYVIKE